MTTSSSLVIYYIVTNLVNKSITCTSWRRLQQLYDNVHNGLIIHLTLRQVEKEFKGGVG